MVLFANPTDVVLSTFMVMGGWICPSSLSVVRIGTASLTFIKVATISASAAEDMAVLIIWNRVWMAMLLVGRVGGLLPFLMS